MKPETSITQQIKAKHDELAGIHASLALYMAMEHPKDTLAKVKVLQDRLEFRVKQYELQLLDEKIGIYGEALKILKG